MVVRRKTRISGESKPDDDFRDGATGFAGGVYLAANLNVVEQRLTMNSSFAAERYDLTPLPFIPFSNTGGEALSDNGVVAGGIANSDGSVSLALWSKGVLTNLGVPPGLPSQDFNMPRVFGINDCGAVVGTIHTSAGELPSRWFIYDRDRFTVQPLVDPTDLGGAAIGINNRGEVVGYDHTSSNRVIGWLWSNGAYSRLPVSGSSTAAQIGRAHV